MRRLSIAVFLLAAFTSVQARRVPEIAWPQFRGPAGAGILDQAKLPAAWSATNNVAWSVEVKGRGWSSPVAWDDQVFVTSAISPGAFKAPQTGIFGNDYVAELSKQGLSDDEVVKKVIARDIELTNESGEIRYMVYAFDAKTGRAKWEREAHKGAPFGGRHRKNTFASETPATDGERLYVYFGNVGLFAYSLDGKPLWNARFEPQPMYLDFGTASSPVVHDGRVYVLHDNDGKSFIAAVDARSGKQLWKVDRDLPAGPSGSGWSTPFIWQNERRTELVVVGRKHAVGYTLDGRGALAPARSHRPVDAHAPGGGRIAVSRDRIAGRIEPPGLRGAGGRAAATSRSPRAKSRTRSWRGPTRARRPTPRRRSSIADGCTW